MPSPSSTPVIRLRADAYAAWADELKFSSPGAAAEFIGVDRSTLVRVLNGDIDPGEKFIAACMSVYDGKFEDLFEIAEAS